MGTIKTAHIISAATHLALEQLISKVEPGWQVVQNISGPQIQIVLLKSLDPKLASKVRFRAFCCGVAKIGFWDLPQQADIKVLGEFVKNLVREFHSDALEERSCLIQTFKIATEPVYVLNQ
jgi:hypothetical protein